MRDTAARPRVHLRGARAVVALSDHLDVAADAGQGGAELVRHGGHERVLGPVRAPGAAGPASAGAAGSWATISATARSWACCSRTSSCRQGPRTGVGPLHDQPSDQLVAGDQRGRDQGASTQSGATGPATAAATEVGVQILDLHALTRARGTVEGAADGAPAGRGTTAAAPGRSRPASSAVGLRPGRGTEPDSARPRAPTPTAAAARSATRSPSQVAAQRPTQRHDQAVLLGSLEDDLLHSCELVDGLVHLGEGAISLGLGDRHVAGAPRAARVGPAGAGGGAGHAPRPRQRTGSPRQVGPWAHGPAGTSRNGQGSGQS